MSQGQTNTFDATTAGIKFTAPNVTLTSANMAINGGLSFDLPLAAVTIGQNNAISYVSSNSAAIRNSIIAQGIIGSDSLDMTIKGSGATFTSISNAAMDSMFNLNKFAISTAENIYGMGIQQRRYEARKNSKLCFITTAICESEGKADDCAELETLRHWRDTVLAESPGGNALIRTYYQIAPPALAVIAARQDAEAIYSVMRERYLLPAIEAIRADDNDMAFQLYCELVDYTLAVASGA